MSHVLVVRLDSLGDVVVCGPAVRAVARTARVTLLAGPGGAEAARLLPGVDDVLVWHCPWIAAPAPPVDGPQLAALVEELRRRAVDEALVLTSFHQSALPTALLLRQAGIRRISAVSEDYAGSLLDVRIAPPCDDPEPVRMLAIAAAAGFRLPPGDDGRLALRVGAAPADVAGGPYVAVHPGADAPSRGYPVPGWQAVVSALTRGGHTVVITGGPADRPAARALAGAARAPGHAVDLAGRTDVAGLAETLRRASVLVAGNTGPAHVAAAVGTPVVSLFSPVVPAVRWAPFGVPTVVLGDQAAPCAGTRARDCPVPGHPCLAGIDPAEVVAAVERLAAAEREAVPA